MQLDTMDNGLGGAILYSGVRGADYRQHSDTLSKKLLLLNLQYNLKQVPIFYIRLQVVFRLFRILPVFYLQWKVQI